MNIMVCPLPPTRRRFRDTRRHTFWRQEQRRAAAQAAPVHPMTDWQMWISVGVFVLVIVVLLVIMGNHEWILAWLAGN